MIHIAISVRVSCHIAFFVLTFGVAVRRHVFGRQSNLWLFRLCPTVGSSFREGSIGSSLFGDSESVSTDDIPVAIPRKATGDWDDGRLGVSGHRQHQHKGYTTVTHAATGDGRRSPVGHVHLLL